ncbi:hypothetical protein ACG7TL_004799 [Trametes sanguinea]
MELWAPNVAIATLALPYPIDPHTWRGFFVEQSGSSHPMELSPPVGAFYQLVHKGESFPRYSPR